MITVRVKNYSKVYKALTLAPKEIAKDAKKQMRRIAEPSRSTAESTAPRVKGDLGGAVRTYVTSRGVKVGVKGVPYAGPRMFAKHIGGPYARSNTPDPFLIRSVRSHRPQILRDVKMLISQTLRRVFDGHS